MAVMIIVFFSSFFIMSAVINTQVVLQDVRNADAETMKQALAIGLHMDETEFHLMDEIFNATMSKLIEKNKKDLHIYTDSELHFVQTDLLIKISRKIKLIMGDLEEYVSHDALVNANFYYDVPQQRIYDEMQGHLNIMSFKKSIDQITNTQNQ